ncbi:DUF4214 domain-containing protein, partial [Hydrogenophilus thiooxidans]|uniref:DUF4214 domain-containing protein n=1 Tax=Hydrogenophilus thiooxidans TaxID=2820326 RepID=UPI001C23CBEC
TQTQDLAPLLMEMARSDERWRQSFAERAPELVRALYRGLLGREPEPEALQDYAERLTQTHDLAPLLMELARSEERWRQSFAERATNLVNQIYNGLMGREADPSGLKTYTDKLIKEGGIQNTLQSIINSDEFNKKKFKQYKTIEVISKINGCGTYAVVHIPHLSFLPWVLAVSDFISQEHHLKIILLTTHDHPLIYEAKKFSRSIIDIINFEEFRSFINRLTNRPKWLVFHAFLQSSRNASLLDCFPDASALVYADGAPNFFFHEESLTEKRKSRVKGLLEFGYHQRWHKYDPNKLPAMRGCIPWKWVFSYYSDIRDAFPKKTIKAKVQATSFLFLRYWHAGRYQIPEPIVLNLLVSIINEEITQQDVLVVKHDYRYNPQLIDLVINHVRALGAQAINFKDYLEQYGLDADPELPFEMTAGPELLASVTKYFVYDSSLAITLPYYLKFIGLHHKVNIICGIPQRFLPRSISHVLQGEIVKFVDLCNKVAQKIYNHITAEVTDQTYWRATIDLKQLDCTALDQRAPLKAQDESESYSHIELIVIYVPDHNFLPCLLALAKNLSQEGFYVVFALSRFLNNFEVTVDFIWAALTIEDLDAALRHSNLKIKKLYVHSFGFIDDVSRLVSLCKDANLCYYGDGFKNEFKLPRNDHKLDEMVFFGFQNKRFKGKSRLIDYNCWLEFVPIVFPIQEKQRGSIGKGMLVCLRYYGLGPYAFGEKTSELIVNTILKSHDGQQKIFLKTDKRHPKLLTEVISGLHAYGLEAIDLAEYIGEIAMQPLEVILQTDVLKEIDTYVVFDSSLSYIIAFHPNVNPDVKIYLGADLESLGVNLDNVSMPNHVEQILQEMGKAERTFIAGLKTIKNYTEFYADALRDAEMKVEALGAAFYLVTRNVKPESMAVNATNKLGYQKSPE